MPVAVVTDSTAYLPQALIDEWGVRVAPVVVTVAGRSYEEGVEITPHQVAEALKEWQPVSTSRPTPAEFSSLFESARTAGADAVVSIHLSSELSGTYESAVLAARTAPIPVEVLDSRSIGMGLGFAVLAAARTAAAGAQLPAVAAAAQAVIDEAQVLFYVDTLEN
jgi:DegV family protein with EDD domain